MINPQFPGGILEALQIAIASVSDAVAALGGIIDTAITDITNAAFSWADMSGDIYSTACSDTSDDTVCDITGKGYLTGIMVSGTNTATTVESVRITITVDGTRITDTQYVAKGWGDASMSGAGMGCIIPFSTSLKVTCDTTDADCSAIVSAAVAIE